MASGKSLVELAKSHLRVGYASFLLIVDALLVTVLIVDLRRFDSLGLRLRDAVHLARQEPPAAILIIVGYLVGLTVIMPACFCLVRIYAGTGPKLSGLLGRRHWSIVVIHIGVSALLAVEQGLADGFRRLSGLAMRDGSLRFLYEPTLPTPLAWLALFALLAAPFLSPGLRWLSEREKAPSWLRDYWILVPLADLKGRLYPIQGRHGVNFDGGLAPEIRLAREAARRSRRSFQRELAASRHAWVELNKARLEATREFISFLLRDVSAPNEIQCDVFTGTSRALDAALARVPGAKQIVMSHVEHPAEEKVAAWHAAVTASPPPIRLIRPGVWTTPWPDTEDWLVAQVQKAVGEVEIPVVFLVSEVSYATGWELPLRSMLKRLEPLRHAGKLYVLVDGAHSAGNMGVVRTTEGWDTYVTSTHKWLYSPEPGGLLFYRARAAGPVAYDAWTRTGPPSSTTAVETIAALFGSAALLHPQIAVNLWKRCAELRALFLGASKKKFVVVGAELGLTPTAMLSVVPTPAFAWVDPDGLEDRFFKENVRLTVVRIDDKPALRLAFHYFQDGVQVLRLARILSGAVRYTSSDQTGPQ